MPLGGGAIHTIIGRRVPRSAADQPVRPEAPDIASLGHRRPGFGRRCLIGRIGGIFACTVIEQQIELGGLEAGDLQLEVEIHFGQGLEFDFQDLAVPAGEFGQAVVSDDIGAPLGRGEMTEHDGRHLGQPPTRSATPPGAAAPAPI